LINFGRNINCATSIYHSNCARAVSAAPLCNYYLFEVPDADSVLMQLWYVIDGDTVRLANGTYVRLVGYDSYELSEAMGPEAKPSARKLMLGRSPRHCSGARRGRSRAA